ncbi:MAG TPA: cupin domain-containing protein [Candidatus Kapabacteria bacterium]|jgi:predicted cupin superfamily sugar epimerase|nr:cupin domain-containing protein [Candidatus Kapabacteria bacterium]HOM04432.1 cupin domain-containing protein [Candidatus Kapabacteria bacterium]HPP40345.1 cupin domain-containing protein [Candidatus Kapabacteria bacterium]
MTAEDVIRRLNLVPHPEGGYFRETYRSDEKISKSALPERYSGDRVFSTAIYFLLQSNENHLVHRLKSDEIWHFYLGSPLLIRFYQDENDVKEAVLGNNLLNNEVPQLLIPRMTWMVARPIAENSFTLVGCTNSPGFEFDDFEIKQF